MKRNKKNMLTAREEPTHLTKSILAQMGSEGKAIQSRLKKVLRERTSAHSIDRQEDKNDGSA